MQEMKELEVLEKVNRVEVPPFLFTRIEARIQSQLNEQLPVRWVWVSLSAVLFLVVINTLILQGNTQLPKSWNASSVQYISEEMGIQTTNQLYQ
ncbi:MAG: hypothetical protein RL266_1015 [Bacteroidota bacterium]